MVTIFICSVAGFPWEMFLSGQFCYSFIPFFLQNCSIEVIPIFYYSLENQLHFPGLAIYKNSLQGDCLSCGVLRYFGPRIFHFFCLEFPLHLTPMGPISLSDLASPHGSALRDDLSFTLRKTLPLERLFFFFSLTSTF